MGVAVKVQAKDGEAEITFHCSLVVPSSCTINEFFYPDGFGVHPGKNQMGMMGHGFDWLGLWYAREGIRIALRAEENHRIRVARLYEQARYRVLSETESDMPWCVSTYPGGHMGSENAGVSKRQPDN